MAEVDMQAAQPKRKRGRPPKTDKVLKLPKLTLEQELTELDQKFTNLCTRLGWNIFQMEIKAEQEARILEERATIKAEMMQMGKRADQIREKMKNIGKAPQ